MNRAIAFAVVAVLCLSLGAWAQESGAVRDTVQAQVMLTVAEGKRLIAKAVAEMPIVKKALAEGTVIVARGTTTTYVAEELTGQSIPHGSYVIGWTGPAKGDKTMGEERRPDDIVLVNGVLQEGVTMEAALEGLKAGDVVIKGANAVNGEHDLAGILIGGGPESTSGTTGKFLPVVVGRKAHLVIPIGLEKEVSGSIVDITNKMREPMESLNNIPSMFLVSGEIMTEIEALELLTGVSAFQAAGGGVGGAEGSARIICRGTREQVQKALELAESIQGEPPFLE